MKKNVTHFLALLILAILPAIILGQTNPHELLIPAPTTTATYLSDSIMGDTLANGQRKDVNRIYLLERGKAYYNYALIRNTGWTLKIKAQPGKGPIPVIYQMKNPTTNAVVGQLIDVRGNVWMQSVGVSMGLEVDPTFVTLNFGSVLTTNAAGFNIEIDSCIFSNVSGQLIRTASACKVIKVKNSTFANSGNLSVSNLGSGKAIDLRDGSCDTLLFVNNTCVNYTDRIIRHRTSTANLNNLIFDHNTIINSCSYHGNLALGWLGNSATVTNNLFIDAFAMGADTDKTRQLEFDENGEKDKFGSNAMYIVFSVPNTTTKWTVKNNYYTATPAAQTWFAKYANGGTSPYFPFAAPEIYGTPLSKHIRGRIGADSTNAFVMTPVTINKAPKLMTALMDWYRSPTGGKKTKNTPGGGYDIYKYDYDRKSLIYYRDSMDCRYKTTEVPYAGGMKGQPAGALTWWKLAIATDVQKTSNEIPTQFVLEQNYPNPFNPTTNISFSLPKEGFTRLNIYNVLGQQVASLVNENLKAGKYNYTFDASKLSTGVYFYSLQTTDYSLTKKMLLVK